MDAGVEHRTNAYRAESNPKGGTALLVSPHLDISAEGADIKFAFFGDYQLRKYIQPQLTNLDRKQQFMPGVDPDDPLQLR